ncbi:pyridoxamine 5'-phosphate oxidase family protein [Micrococcaceae bacterium Sec5.7]
MRPKQRDLTERLAPDECWELLDRTVVGRLAVIVGEHPEIFPVNYVVDQNTIIFRTGFGTKLWSTVRDQCALEIDGYDAVAASAWSVMARGRAELVLDPGQQAAAGALHLDPWQPGDKNHYLRLTPESLTGRRFKTTRPDIWNTPDSDARTSSFH